MATLPGEAETWRPEPRRAILVSALPEVASMPRQQLDAVTTMAGGRVIPGRARLWRNKRPARHKDHRRPCTPLHFFRRDFLSLAKSRTDYRTCDTRGGVRVSPALKRPFSRVLPTLLSKSNTPDPRQ